MRNDTKNPHKNLKILITQVGEVEVGIINLKKRKQYSFHSIRHNVCTNFDRAKVEERIAARLVGHSTVGATMNYGYYSEGVEFEEALEAVNKLPVL